MASFFLCGMIARLIGLQITWSIKIANKSIPHLQSIMNLQSKELQGCQNTFKIALLILIDNNAFMKRNVWRGQKTNAIGKMFMFALFAHYL